MNGEDHGQKTQRGSWELRRVKALLQEECFWTNSTFWLPPQGSTKSIHGPKAFSLDLLLNDQKKSSQVPRIPSQGLGYRHALQVIHTMAKSYNSVEFPLRFEKLRKSQLTIEKHGQRPWTPVCLFVFLFSIYDFLLVYCFGVDMEYFIRNLIQYNSYTSSTYESKQRMKISRIFDTGVYPMGCLA